MEQKKLDVLKQRLAAQISTMSPSEARAAQWLVRHIGEVAWSRIEDVSVRSGVSSATIIRAIKSAGFSGYFEFQRLVRSELPTGTLATRLAQESTHRRKLTPISAVVTEEKANLDQLEDALAPVIDQLIEFLIDSKKILVVASMMTAPLAEYLALHLRMLLGDVEYVNAASGDGWLRLRDLQPDSLVIGLSYPRYGEATRSFLTRARERTDRVVLITDQAGPSLDHLALDIRLPSFSNSDSASTVVLMALRQILARYLQVAVPDRVLTNLDAADKLWSPMGLLRKK